MKQPPLLSLVCFVIATLGMSPMLRANGESAVAPAAQVATESLVRFSAGHKTLRLASQPIISGTMRDVEKKPECRLEDVKEELLTESPEKRLRISGRIAAAVEPYALIAYNDPEGNSDYNATSWPAQLDTKNRFTVEIGEFVPGAAELRLVVCHVNGATTVIRRPLTVGADGLPLLKP